MKDATADGYRLVGIDAEGCLPDACPIDEICNTACETEVLLEKFDNLSNGYEYRVLQPMQKVHWTNMTIRPISEKNLDDAGANGFRLAFSVSDGTPRYLFAVMEKAPNETRRFRYKIVGAPRLADLSEGLNEAFDTGYRVVHARGTSSGFVTISEKRE
jgi:hypothetical protein